MDTDAIARDMARGISCENIGAKLGHSSGEVRIFMMTPEGICSLTAAVTARRKEKLCQPRVGAKTERPTSPKTPARDGSSSSDVAARRLAARRKEFDDMCWDHTRDEFLSQFNEHPPITEDEGTALLDILAPFSEDAEDADSSLAASRAADRAVENGIEILHRVLQLTGLTRNKILQDIKSHVKANGIPIRKSSLRSVIGTDDGRRIAAEQIAPWLAKTFEKFPINMNTLEGLNAATWTSYIRQARAKKSGHNVEHVLARLFKNCELPFGPERKAEKPMSGDAKIDGVSYDLMSPSKNPLVLIKCSAHTANLGQYGDKIIHEMNLATESIGGNPDITFLVFVDGVGMDDRQDVLNCVFTKADEFCQFRTLWKAAVIVANKCGRQAAVALPRRHHARFAPFCEKWGANLLDLATLDSDTERWIKAGDGFVHIRE